MKVGCECFWKLLVFESISRSLLENNRSHLVGAIVQCSSRARDSSCKLWLCIPIDAPLTPLNNTLPVAECASLHKPYDFDTLPGHLLHNVLILIL